jgi:hypothetical protein
MEIMNSAAQTSEHRWGGRFPVNARVEIWLYTGPATDAVLRDASFSGAFLETNLQLPVLTAVCLRVVPDGPWLEGTVVRIEAAGLAIEWREPGLGPLSALITSRLS